MLVVTNEDAGSTDEDSTRRVVTALRQHRDSVTVVTTGSPDELRAALARHDDRTVVCVGGDGSLHALLQALHDAGQLDQRTVGLLPLGTGNDFARGVGLPAELDEALAVLLHGTARPVDLLVDEDGGVVVNAVHAGVGAVAGYAARPVKPLLGTASFLVGAVLAGLGHRGRRLRVVVDGRVIADGRRRLLMVGVANARTIAGGAAVLGPDATVLDGHADVSVSFAVGPFARIGYALRLRTGRHPERADVVALSGRRIEVGGDEFSTNADGELAGPFHRRAWRVHQGAWRLLMPA
ncbi:MAG: diacylglycerol kinase family protein [Actinocatenispora sp.]